MHVHAKIFTAYGRKDRLTHILVQLHHSHIHLTTTCMYMCMLNFLLFMAERQADAQTGANALLTHIRLTTKCTHMLNIYCLWQKDRLTNRQVQMHLLHMYS